VSRPAKKTANARAVSLSLADLQKVGAFTGRPVEKEIRWKQGDEELTATVYVRPLGFQAAVSEVMSAANKHDGVAGRIAASICDQDGKAIFTVADITGEADPARGALDGSLSVALLLAIGEVNNLGKATS